MGLLLTIVTLGIYPLFWHYAAFKELYDQEKQEFPTLWYVLCYVPLVSLVALPVFMSKNLDFLNELRARNQLAPIFGIGGFLAWYVLGELIVVGPFIAYHRLQTAINDVWDIHAKKAPVPAPVAVPA
ncbi:MAG TPA: DUF4234 domain-containing protein [Polyangiales bacterium]|nr:DUF4234 domain-containing protein [Polyangiales bacterium]